jgi:dTDP-glucose pyrophosphorylase/predicted SnoaL-like aldol condensation-catalyzing enzyme
MIQIVVPMAGRGSRFTNAGFTTPKPLIPVGGKPMIQWVIENVRPAQEHRFTFICLKEHLDSYPEVPQTLRSLCPGCNIVTVDKVTEGAACTVLLASEFIDNKDALMIANADQYVDLDINDYLAELDRQQADGLIMTFEANHPKWSYCRMNDSMQVVEVVEKIVVSNEATVGIYNFRHGADFVRAASRMIELNLRSNGEFYVAPSYNLLIKEGKKIVVARTGYEYSGMYGLGIPEDLEYFMTTQSYEKARIDKAVPLGGTSLIAALTKQYVNFFNARNLAGIKSMLVESFALEDPAVTRMEGKTAVLSYISDIFDNNPDIEFRSHQIIADDTRSMIEFSLIMGGKQLKGVDVLEWDGRLIKELRAYLY